MCHLGLKFLVIITGLFMKITPVLAAPRCDVGYEKKPISEEALRDIEFLNTRWRQFVGERLQKAIDDYPTDQSGQKLNRSQLAKELSISETRMRVLTQGKGTLTIVEAQFLAKRLNVEVSWLLAVDKIAIFFYQYDHVTPDMIPGDGPYRLLRQVIDKYFLKKDITVTKAKTTNPSVEFHKRWKEEVGNRIRQIMVEFGEKRGQELSHAELGRMMGGVFSQPLMSAILTGRRGLTYDEAMFFATALKVDVNRILAVDMIVEFNNHTRPIHRDDFDGVRSVENFIDVLYHVLW